MHELHYFSFMWVCVCVFKSDKKYETFFLIKWMCIMQTRLNFSLSFFCASFIIHLYWNLHHHVDTLCTYVWKYIHIHTQCIKSSHFNHEIVMQWKKRSVWGFLPTESLHLHKMIDFFHSLFLSFLMYFILLCAINLYKHITIIRNSSFYNKV